MIEIKQLEFNVCIMKSIFVHSDCKISKNLKSTVLKAFLILVCSKMATITSFVCKFTKHVCVFMCVCTVYTTELSRSLA